jgi:hypothetical protein
MGTGGGTVPEAHSQRQRRIDEYDASTESIISLWPFVGLSDFDPSLLARLLKEIVGQEDLREKRPRPPPKAAGGAGGGVCIYDWPEIWFPSQVSWMGPSLRNQTVQLVGRWCPVGQRHFSISFPSSSLGTPVPEALLRQRTRLALFSGRQAKRSLADMGPQAEAPGPGYIRRRLRFTVGQRSSACCSRQRRC